MPFDPFEDFAAEAAMFVATLILSVGVVLLAPF